MTAPRQASAHMLDPKKGWPSQTAVDFVARLSANVTIDPFYAGRCAHLNSEGEYETGIPAVAPASGKVYVPIFIFQNSDDPDVSNDGGITGSESDEPGGWMGVYPRGFILGLVGSGSYELSTTEFEPEASLGSSYAPNDALRAIHANTNAVTGGRITKGTVYTHPIVGSVSRAVEMNSNRKQVLSFWPLVIPPTA